MNFEDVEVVTIHQPMGMRLMGISLYRVDRYMTLWVAATSGSARRLPRSPGARLAAVTFCTPESRARLQAARMRMKVKPFPLPTSGFPYRLSIEDRNLFIAAVQEGRASHAPRLHVGR